uniref:Thioredoxin domain-containing protein n=2 Tax=Ditylum brightwellii TaxID=49249 RepID=A0A7S4QW39_9STRA
MSRPWTANIDMYRKVPNDLLESSRRGSIMSTMAIIVMTTLFIMETRAFFRSDLVSDLALDSNDDPKVRVNFNITMMDMKCEFATIDVISVLETEQNVTQHVQKRLISSEGVRERYDHRNRDQHDIVMYDESVTETMEELLKNGEFTIELDGQTLDFAEKSQKFLFVDFYASWCSHCRDLAPTWETLAQVMAIINIDVMEDKYGEDEVHSYTDEEFEEARKASAPVFIAKVDCVKFPDLCQKEGIMAYPTLRLFSEGKFWSDYKGHRTIMEMVSWLRVQEDEYAKEKGEKAVMEKVDAETIAWDSMQMTEEIAQWNDEVRNRRVRVHEGWWDEAEHVGCELSGFLMVNRAPGNFRIQARSKMHEVDPYLANVSHEVHHLSFGDPVIFKHIEEGNTVTPPQFLESTKPIDGNVYITKRLHEAHHHFLKVVTTNFNNLASKFLWNSVDYQGSKKKAEVNTKKKNYGRAYQMLVSSKKSLYAENVVPEAKFTYDLSPISVSYRKKSRHWYDYLTSLMAIIGGTFTFVGMMEKGVYAMSSKKRR